MFFILSNVPVTKTSSAQSNKHQNKSEKTDINASYTKHAMQKVQPKIIVI